MEKKQTFSYKIATTIIDRRFLIVLLFVLLSIFCALKISDTVVQNDLTQYLSEDSETRVGLEAMEDNFGESTFVSFMIKDSGSTATSILEDNETISIASVSEEVDEYTLYSLIFDSEDDALNGKNFIEENFSDSEYYIYSTVYNDSESYIESEMHTALIYVIIVIIAVLLVTSKSFAEIPILLVVFGVAALLSMGTNFIFDDISYISNSVSVILQLALAIDYALIFIHRYNEERENNNSITASKIALSKAMPEVLTSSLTTICGLVSLSFMTYQIGNDMAMVLIKSIIISLISVFSLLPALVVIFDKIIQKTIHRNLVPNISKTVEKFINLRKFIIPIFLVLAIFGISFSAKAEYTFSSNNIILQSDSDYQKIESVFGESNVFVVLVPTEENTANFISEIEQLENVENISSLTTYEVFEGVTLYTDINYMAVAQMLSLDEDAVMTLFGGYAAENEESENFYQDAESYNISLINLLDYLETLILNDSLSEDLTIQINELLSAVNNLESQFVSEEYSRILITTNLDVEGTETYNFIDELEDLTEEYLSSSHIVGESINSYELEEAFSSDKIIVNGLSVVFIALILLFTFKSFKYAIAMIFCIQTAINLNFAIPYFQSNNLFFIGYLVVVAIQMGATIDYAIVISNRYKQLLKTLPPKEAIKKAVDNSFSTILSSGGVLCLAGLILSKASSDYVISSLGECLADGTLISILLVLFVLPSLLYLITSKKHK